MNCVSYGALAVLLISALLPASANDIAPGGTLRAVYLGSNPAQAMRDPASGEVRGASADLARELAQRAGIPLEFKPAASPPAVIDAVKSGAADIGFVAYEATRLGTVEFSQTYMLVRQSFLVLDGSPIPRRCGYRPRRSEDRRHAEQFDHALPQAHPQACPP